MPRQQPQSGQDSEIVLDKYRIDGILGLLQMYRESVLTLSNYAIYFNGTEFEVKIHIGEGDDQFIQFRDGRHAIDYVLRDELTNVE